MKTTLLTPRGHDVTEIESTPHKDNINITNLTLLFMREDLLKDIFLIFIYHRF